MIYIIKQITEVERLDPPACKIARLNFHLFVLLHLDSAMKNGSLWDRGLLKNKKGWKSASPLIVV